MKSSVIHVFTALLLISLLLTGCLSDEPRVEQEAEEEQQLAVLESEAEIVLSARTIINTLILVEWNTDSNHYEQLLSAKNEIILEGVRSLRLEDRYRMIIEQEDTSLVFYDLETMISDSLFIEPLGEVAGPKQPDYYRPTRELVFTRIEDESFKLYHLKSDGVVRNVPEEFFSSADPVISPRFMNDASQVVFGIFDIDAGITGIFFYDFKTEETSAMGEVAGELQQLEVSPVDGSLIALSFEEQTGILSWFEEARWREIWKRDTRLGDAFTLSHTKPVLAVPMYEEDRKSMLLLDFHNNAMKAEAVTLEGDALTPLFLEIH